ncbi:MAG: TonB-dependent receptor [Gemmatimonadales bacterium]|nr:TonB-dependent receptor [Gemmatimonadales bacterium]
MVRRVVGLIPGLILAAAAAAPLMAQTGTIRGSITDSAGAGLANAAVSVEGTALRANSSVGGRYEIRGVPPGTRTLRVRLIGFQAGTSEVAVPEGGEVNHDVTLERSAVQLAPIDVVVGSRARHTAEEELAVPVDIFPAEMLERQGTTETGVILQTLSPSINFPRQSVTDATDIVRPFTLRGLSPDHTLVLVNGWRRHQTAVVNTFAYGTGAGSSGVDLNAIPASALERVEVLRDGASAQYGSDAIAGVVNLVIKDGEFRPFLSAEGGRYVTADYDDDGTTFNVNGGYGFRVGRGTLGIFGEYRDRDETNRAWADPFDTSVTGVADEVDEQGNVITKNNPVPQPNHHWGDGEARDVLTFANFRHPLNESASAEVYAFGGYSFRNGTGNGYRRYADSERNWPQIYELGFLPEFDSDATDYSANVGVRGVVSGWNYDVGGTIGHNHFDYNLTNTLNTSLGPCLDEACAPGPDGVLGTADDPGIPNQTDFFSGRLSRNEMIAAVNISKPVDFGLPEAVNLAFGTVLRGESYEISPGELASYVDGGSLDQYGDDAPGGSQVFPGFSPADATDESRTNFGLYADAESNLTSQLLANAALRFESYSDFGERVTGKLALRYQPSRRLTFRAAAGTGFRAPGLSQSFYSHITTNFIFDPDVGAPVPVEVGNFPVEHPASLALGAEPLRDETSFNFSGGLAVTPTENLTLTADYFHIEINDRILLGATFDDEATLGILAANGFGSIGGVQYFTNGLDTRTQGVDFTANLRVPAGDAGQLDFSGYVNYTHNEITRVDPLPQVLQDAGSTEPGLLDIVTQVGIEEERPEWRATLQGQYSRGRLSGLARVSYFGGFASAQPGFCDECREEYGAKTLFDAEVGYQVGLVNLALGARNLFDTYPDQASELNSFLIFPWAAASPFGYNGRWVYVRSRVTFP